MMIKTRVATVCIISIMLASCAHTGTLKGQLIADDQSSIVSQDFVSAISKLKGFSPRSSTVQFYKPKTVFAKQLHDTMRDAGYGLQIIPKNETAPNLIRYYSQRYDTQTGTSVTYEVSVGEVKLGREYEIRAGRIFPIAALSVQGAQVSHGATTNNNLFKEPSYDKWVPVPTSSGTTPLIPTPENGQRRASDNVSLTGVSAYSTFLQDYRDKHIEILDFNYDSLRLNKALHKQIESIARRFDPKNDVISVLSCSHGKTSIANGNELLSNGRAATVKKEFVNRMVPAGKVLDEACWSDRSVPGLPNRGVVVTLHSKINDA